MSMTKRAMEDPESPFYAGHEENRADWQRQQQDDEQWEEEMRQGEAPVDNEPTMDVRVDDCATRIDMANDKIRKADADGDWDMVECMSAVLDEQHGLLEEIAKDIRTYMRDHGAAF